MNPILHSLWLDMYMLFWETSWMSGSSLLQKLGVETHSWVQWWSLAWILTKCIKVSTREFLSLRFCKTLVLWKINKTVKTKNAIQSLTLILVQGHNTGPDIEWFIWWTIRQFTSFKMNNDSVKKWLRKAQKLCLLPQRRHYFIYPGFPFQPKTGQTYEDWKL